MTDSISHLRRPNRLLLFLSLPLLALVLNSSVAGSYKRVVRSSSDEIVQLRDHITGYAQNFIGLKYRYAGTKPQTGFDCSGFTSYVLGEFEVGVSHSSSVQSKQGDRIALGEVMPGDLVFFGRSGRIQHVAMVVERTEEGIFCVHSTCSRGIIVENINKSSYWKPRILFARDVITGQTES